MCLCISLLALACAWDQGLVSTMGIAWNQGLISTMGIEKDDQQVPISWYTLCAWYFSTSTSLCLEPGTDIYNDV